MRTIFGQTAKRKGRALDYLCAETCELRTFGVCQEAESLASGPIASCNILPAKQRWKAVRAGNYAI